MRGVRTCDGAVDDGTVLELDGDRLIVELHQKSTNARESVLVLRISDAVHTPGNFQAA